MAQKKSTETNERAVDLDSLAPDLQKKAHGLGFRQKVSPNKIARTVEAEKRSERLSLFFAVPMVVITLVFVALRFTAGPESRNNVTLVAIVAGLWALGAWISAKRHQGRIVSLGELQAVVSEKLGR